MKEKNDVIAELERLDRFYDGDEPGEMPLEVLRARGLDIPDDDAVLDDASMHGRLWDVLRAMADLGMVLEFTDHLSDRELYRYLVREALREETLLPGDAYGTWHLSPIGGGSEEDAEINLRFYADDEERESWERDFGGPIPPKEPRPYDRDRLLPTGVERMLGDVQ